VSGAKNIGVKRLQSRPGYGGKKKRNMLRRHQRDIFRNLTEMARLGAIAFGNNLCIADEPFRPFLCIFVRFLGFGNNLAHEALHIVGVVEAFVVMVNVRICRLEEGVRSEETGSHTYVALERPLVWR
jgi:hypothetical protein